MHHGQAPPSQGKPAGLPQSDSRKRSRSAFDENLDELISTAAKNAEEPSKATPLKTNAQSTDDKKAKKDKDKIFKLVYSDQTVSPEEKMAALPRYAFVPDHKRGMMLGAPKGSVTGTVDSH